MDRTFPQLKNIVEDWIKIVGLSFQDITEEEKPKNKQLEWILKISDIIFVFMVTGRIDRITIQSPIRFAEQHQNATSQLNDIEFLKFILAINEPLIIAGLTPIYEQNQKTIKAITIQSYLDTESLQREQFYKEWDKIAGFYDIIIKKVQAKFGVTGLSTTSSNQSGTDKPFYG
jgi:hypothetical protein